jgi:putative effector of murein hydrolase LrgA (UPF0299 family)
VQDNAIAGLALEDPFRMGNDGIKIALAASEGEQVSANVSIPICPAIYAFLLPLILPMCGVIRAVSVDSGAPFLLRFSTASAP